MFDKVKSQIIKNYTFNKNEEYNDCISLYIA